MLLYWEWECSPFCLGIEIPCVCLCVEDPVLTVLAWQNTMAAKTWWEPYTHGPTYATILTDWQVNSTQMLRGAFYSVFIRFFTLWRHSWRHFLQLKNLLNFTWLTFCLTSKVFLFSIGWDNFKERWFRKAKKKKIISLYMHFRCPLIAYVGQYCYSNWFWNSWQWWGYHRVLTLFHFTVPQSKHCVRKCPYRDSYKTRTSRWLIQK